MIDTPERPHLDFLEASLALDNGEVLRVQRTLDAAEAEIASLREENAKMYSMLADFMKKESAEYLREPRARSHDGSGKILSHSASPAPEEKP